MRALLIIVCVFIATQAGAVREDSMILELAEAFKVGIDDVNKCFNKTQATSYDFEVLKEVIRYPDIETSLEGNARTASCAFACIGQVNGMMIGAKLQLAKFQSLAVDRPGIPEEVATRNRKMIDTCYEVVKDETDECAVGLKFLTCLDQMRRKP